MIYLVISLGDSKCSDTISIVCFKTGILKMEIDTQVKFDIYLYLQKYP